MNYLELIRGFWRSHEEHLFTPTEIAVYFYLVEVCNICQWKNPFKRNNAKIGADLSISFNTLKNARNKLQQAGLIYFKTVNGSPNVVYTLSKFDKVNVEVSNEVDVEVDVEVDNQVLPTKDKLNINKTKVKLGSTKVLPCGTLQHHPENINYKALVDFFNSETKCAFGRIRYPISEKRKKHIRARINLHGKESLFEVIKKAGASSFMKGQNKNNWVASFDWIIKPTNYEKILSGNYDDKKTGGNSSAITDSFMQNVAEGIARGFTPDE